MKQKFSIVFCLAYSLFMAYLALQFSQAEDQVKSMLVAGSGVVLGLIPAILVKWTRTPFSSLMNISYIAFLFSSQYLGTIRHWYGLGWWDTFIHFISGLMLAFIAKATFEHFFRSLEKMTVPIAKFLFILSFSALGAVLWEIYEFSGDQFFATTMQGGGNFDTMTDMIAGVIGGLIVASYAGIRARVSSDNSHRN
ncbi:hypothetical protein QR721_13210 [Aciduricibacillus chroicocephali]|uniref:Membrane-spanning protein n=1 Tax=Aciduricibacillus chroicocephali TaxID=3054939 RepID=A0ABY9KV04_9BACI|nr:hypothetical protein QR721_13210 [Bacillaceae bacterium 44XB]